MSVALRKFPGLFLQTVGSAEVWHSVCVRSPSHDAIDDGRDECASEVKYVLVNNEVPRMLPGLLDSKRSSTLSDCIAEAVVRIFTPVVRARSRS